MSGAGITSANSRATVWPLATSSMLSGVLRLPRQRLEMFAGEPEVVGARLDELPTDHDRLWNMHSSKRAGGVMRRCRARGGDDPRERKPDDAGCAHG